MDLNQELKPFPSQDDHDSKHFRIEARAHLSAKDLSLYFKMVGEDPSHWEKVIFPARKNISIRKAELWKETCIECFIPTENSSGYLEFNGSTSGDWNWYSLKDYRKDLTEFPLTSGEEPKLKSFVQKDSVLECEWKLPVGGIEQGFQSLGVKNLQIAQIGISLVMNTAAGPIYWALKHDGVKPDFHLRSSFIYPVRSRV